MRSRAPRRRASRSGRGGGGAGSGWIGGAMTLTPASMPPPALPVRTVRRIVTINRVGTCPRLHMMGEPTLDAVLAAAARLQALVPDAVLVGGSAAALHAAHRVSFDDDHVLADLRERFDSVLALLEAHPDWVTARVRPPVLILGRFHGVETGIRQLRRRRPLEVEEVMMAGAALRVPTLAEMLRVKAFLALTRNATRDYLDVVALAQRLGVAAPAVLAALDDWYADQLGPDGSRVVTQLVRQLAEPQPYDLDAVDLPRYRGLVPRWRDWAVVEEDCLALAHAILDLAAG